MGTQRNAPCSCGSGKKYKNCCAVKKAQPSWLATAGISAFIVITGFAVVQLVKGAREGRVIPEGYVWNEEHGHMHRVGGTEADAAPGRPAPEGSVWSEEHQHYHGPDGREIRWSPAQDAWLDADGNPIPQS